VSPRVRRWRGIGLALGVALALGLGLAFVPVGGGAAPARPTRPPLERLDLAAFSADRPRAPLRLLFVHHSCGGQLLAEPGPDVGSKCIYQSHPNGGGLRRALQAEGYEIHEASYGSVVGENTDLFDWLPKMRGSMDRLLATDHQDQTYADGRRNQIVVFKSCFTESAFVGEGTPPGDPKGPARTVWNARATMTALRAELARRPEVLFVYVTAPPSAPSAEATPAWRWLAGKLRGRPQARAALARSGPLARQFNEWVAARDGWLAGYPHTNVAVFDYYDVLTAKGRSDYLAYTGADPTDAHPARPGNEAAAREFVPFLNRAVRRAGLSP
jgi:hypothetical protein